MCLKTVSHIIRGKTDSLRCILLAARDGHWPWQGCCCCRRRTASCLGRLASMSKHTRRPPTRRGVADWPAYCRLPAFLLLIIIIRCSWGCRTKTVKEWVMFECQASYRSLETGNELGGIREERFVKFSKHRFFFSQVNRSLRQLKLRWWIQSLVHILYCMALWSVRSREVNIRSSMALYTFLPNAGFIIYEF